MSSESSRFGGSGSSICPFHLVGGYDGAFTQALQEMVDGALYSVLGPVIIWHIERCFINFEVRVVFSSRLVSMTCLPNLINNKMHHLDFGGFHTS